MDEEKDEFINPIDPDKITNNPGFLPYAHHAGSALIKPEDEGKLKSRALRAMEDQTEAQLKQIYEQMQLLAKQAKSIQDRKSISEIIYGCEMKFEPLINHTYFLYQKEEKYILLLISPKDWGRSKNSLIYLATVKLLSDHTWDLIETSEFYNLS